MCEQADDDTIRVLQATTCRTSTEIVQKGIRPVVKIQLKLGLDVSRILITSQTGTDVATHLPRIPVFQRTMDHHRHHHRQQQHLYYHHHLHKIVYWI